MKRNALIFGILTGLTLVLSPAVCFSKPIKVLAQFPMSGPVGTLPEFGWGFIDGMNDINGKGGVNGKPITYFLEDMRYSPTVEVANFTRYAAAEKPDELLLASGYITGALKPLIEKVNKEERIPWLDGSYSTEIFGPEGGPSKYPYYYSLGATYGDQMRALLNWIKDDSRGKGRVAIVYSPTEWGRDPLDMTRAHAKKIGLQIVAEEEYAFTATDATPQVTNVRKAKANYVFYHGYSGAAPYTAIFMKTAKQYLKTATILGTHYTTGQYPILICGKAVDGMVGVATRPQVDDMSNPMVKMAHEFAEKNKRKEGIKDMFLYMEGLTYALIFHETLSRADKAGQLTREGVKKVLDDMIWDYHGLFDGRSFAYKSHTIPMLRIYRCKVEKEVEKAGRKVGVGTWLPISPWINAEIELK
ncbi:MAG: ABC transporter substrate-binding protein [Syntrophaceae bacterium]|nr:ABC transporter substrate-binding protein [Syntrophaceae bacterium]